MGAKTKARMMIAIEDVAGANGLQIVKGSRYLETDPIVHRVGWNFIAEDEASERALGAARRNVDKSSSPDRAAVEEAQQRLGASKLTLKPQALPLSLRDLVIAIRTASAPLGLVGTGLFRRPAAVTVNPGEFVPKTHALVREYADRFIPVAEDDVATENAMVALEELHKLAPDGTVDRKIWKGQWLDYRDEMCQVHPDSFAQVDDPRVFAMYAGSAGGIHGPMVVARPDQVRVVRQGS